jgi:hypothetical protein
MKHLLLTLFTVASLQTSAQARYCTSFDDYLAGNWMELPSIHIIERSKSKQMWSGGGDYSLTTNDKGTDKKLRKTAFAIQSGDSLFINLGNIGCDNNRFGKGYAFALPLPENKILFTGRRIDKAESNRQANVQFAFGLVGAVISSNSNMKRPACYIIENISLGKHYIPARLLGDDLITKLLKGHDDLIDEYFLEEDKMNRETSVRILPLLRKAGIIE